MRAKRAGSRAAAGEHHGEHHGEWELMEEFVIAPDAVGFEGSIQVVDD